jgi:hypothetical protein
MKMTNQKNQTATAPTIAEKINEAADSLGAKWSIFGRLYRKKSRKKMATKSSDHLIR